MRICVITYYCKVVVGPGVQLCTLTDGPGAWQHCGDSMLCHIVPRLIGPDFPSIETRQLDSGFQIGKFRPIRVDHTNCLQVDIKTHSP